jgi:hypothetical protein
MVWRREEPRESQLAEGCSTLFSRQARRARGGAAAEGHVRRGARGAVAGVGARGPPAQAPGGVHGGTAGVHEELHHGVSRMSMWSLWKARPRAPGRGVLSPGEYGSAEKSGREVRQREIRYLKPAEAAAHILGKCKENVFNGRPVGRPPRPPTAAAARRQPLLLAASRVPAAAALDGPGGGRGGGCPHHTLGCHTALQRTLPICKRLYVSLCVPRGYSVISPVQRACNRRRLSFMALLSCPCPRAGWST